VIRTHRVAFQDFHYPIMFDLSSRIDGCTLNEASLNLLAITKFSCSAIAVRVKFTARVRLAGRISSHLRSSWFNTRERDPTFMLSCVGPCFVWNKGIQELITYYN
jgi:hypothetical protein